MIEKAFAKINIGLQVINKKDNGYHNLKTIMASIDLFDQLEFFPCNKIVLKANQAICQLEENVIYRLACFMKEKYQVRTGVLIVLDKKIPVGAGLGGGSSDAAATIRGLNKFWNLNLKKSEIFEIACSFGSDIMFCLDGGLALVEGEGNLLTPLKINLNYQFLLIYPNVSVSTKLVFENHQIIEDDGRFLKLLKTLKTGHLEGVLFNDLETTVERLFYEKGFSVEKIKKKLLEYGLVDSFMSGSGSTVLALLPPNFSFEIVSILQKQYPKSQIHIVSLV